MIPTQDNLFQKKTSLILKALSSDFLTTGPLVKIWEKLKKNLTENMLFSK